MLQTDPDEEGDGDEEAEDEEDEDPPADDQRVRGRGGQVRDGHLLVVGLGVLGGRVAELSGREKREMYFSFR